MSHFVLIFIIFVSSVLSQDTKSSLENYCIVESPMDYTIFNLTTIQQKHKDLHIRITEDEILYLNFCRELGENCIGKQYTMCLESHGQEIGIGKGPPQVTVKEGKILFKYTGEKCPKGHNYTFNVEMRCDMQITEIVKVNFDPVVTPDQCDFNMTIDTATACVERIQTVCELNDNTAGYYDFTSLTNFGNNYRVKINETVSVVLNVCHSLLYGDHFDECDQKTMVCLVDETDKRNVSYKKLGSVNDDVMISVANGGIMYDITSDISCQQEESNELTLKTTILFVCNEKAIELNINKSPKYVSGYGTCHYKFEWETVAACSEEVLNRISEKNHRPCTITDPLTSQVYDFSFIESKLYGAIAGNTEYQFSICSPLKDPICKEPGTAVCKVNQEKELGISAGQANTKLTWRKGSMFLNYTDGVACGNNQRMNSTVTLECSKDVDIEVQEADPCSANIFWRTIMACNRRCATADLKVKLDKLTRPSSNYVIRGETNFTEYHLNVCEPLINDNFTVCGKDTAICKIVRNEKGEKIDEISLGIAESDLNEEELGRVYLRYKHGSVCPEDSNKRISSEIAFTCDMTIEPITSVFRELGTPFFMSRAYPNYLKLYEGRPVLTDYNNCKYHFDWRSTHRCESIETNMHKDCGLEMVDSKSKDMIVGNNTSFKLISRNGTVGTYQIEECGKIKNCTGIFYCDGLHGHPTGGEDISDYNKNLVLFRFKNENTCRTNFFTFLIRNTWCTVWAGVGTPFLLNKRECNPNRDCIGELRVKEGENKIKNPEKPASITRVLTIVGGVIGLIGLLKIVWKCMQDGRLMIYTQNVVEFVNQHTPWRTQRPSTPENINGISYPNVRRKCLMRNALSMAPMDYSPASQVQRQV